MRRVIFSPKGGVGKSSITCNLAAIAADRGLRTLVIDLDVQGNSSLYLGVDVHAPEMEHKEANVAHLLRRAAGSWISSAPPAIGFVRETEFERLDLLASSAELTQIGRELESRYKIYKLREALDELSDQYDRVFIDTPPTFDFYSKTALIAADRILIPYDCDRFSRHALDLLLQNALELRADHNPKLTIEGIVINQFNPSAKLPKELVAELRKDQLPVLESYLTSSVKMRESHVLGRPLIHLARGHKLTTQLVALFEEIERGRPSE
jgi:chromosome partitioning protein